MAHQRKSWKKPSFFNSVSKIIITMFLSRRFINILTVYTYIYLVEEDWELRDGQYHIAAKDLLHENISSGISILELEEPFFQNPFPWGQSYRFPYRPIFNCGFMMY